MQQIHNKTLQDLEFPTVLEQLVARCNTELGKAAALQIKPLSDTSYLNTVLGQTSEYLASYENDNRIPNHSFDAITKELKLLTIENTTLEISGFRRIASLCKTISIHKKFFKKFKEYYPLLFAFSETIIAQKNIIEEIDSIIDKFGEVRDNASTELKNIRHQINEVRGKINQSFAAALTRYQTSDFLDEIRESVVDNRRVLAVKAMHRKKVKGTVVGTSKTGSIAFIVPEATLQYTTTLSNLEFEEKEEIQKILNQLTNYIRPYSEVLENYQHFLIHIDITAAKAKYGSEMNAVLPKINSERQLHLRDAYHPLLFLSNKQKKEKTWPQSIELHQEKRIIVISGPNAGGKSITLKTIGLLQVMLQSGLLIPVHERSTVFLFDKILTDIGDNQSIENHLSTYSCLLYTSPSPRDS